VNKVPEKPKIFKIGGEWSSFGVFSWPTKGGCKFVNSVEIIWIGGFKIIVVVVWRGIGGKKEEQKIVNPILGKANILCT
jgi:hypothetical protein